jgi:hypothetical protein
MDNTTRDKNQKFMKTAQALTNLVFGLFITTMGVIFVVPHHFGIKQIVEVDKGDILIPLLGVICLLYGAFRLYRAYLIFRPYR